MPFFSLKCETNALNTLIVSVVLLSLSSYPLPSSGMGGEAKLGMAGTWQQNNERCVPPPRNKSYSYKMTVELSDNILRVHITSNNGHGERQNAFTYEIGGKELVYIGSDGDEFHARVHWDGDALVFDIVEHEGVRLIRSRDTWTLIDSGKSLQRVRESPDERSRAIYVLERI